jgi:hypothetical protein
MAEINSLARRQKPMLVFTGSVIVLALAMSRPSCSSAQTVPPTNQSHPLGVRVPFVGCASDGQAGPAKAPQGTSKVVATSPEIALRLAYYKAKYGSGILAPRGWHCFGTYGSNGNNLYVSPNQIADPIFLSHWNGFTGAAIQVSDVLGDTSGRFEVAEIVARVFPAHAAFVKSVVTEGIQPASSFPRGPYPGDRLTYLNNEVVEYETPANQSGLGTISQLKKNGSPIRGVSILTGKTPNLIHLSVRLPPDATDLGPVIIRQLERDTLLGVK